jgi:large repetitive protein
MRRLLRLALPGVIAAAMVLALNCGQALASNVHCGDVITQDTTLDSDLVCSSAPALAIGADNVTLNLGGHAIRLEGETAGTAITGEPYNAERHNVTIENGMLDRGGINMLYPTAVVRGLTLVHGACISLLVARALIEDNEIVGPSEGIYLGVNYESQVRHNVIRGGGGISVGDTSSSVSITDNVITGGSTGVDVYRSDAEVARNRILNNTFSGVSVGRSSGSPGAVHDNVISRNGVGVAVYLGYATLRANVISHNSGDGITVGYEASLDARDNAISQNGGNGALVNGFSSAPATAQLIGNRISSNALDGVHIGEFTFTRSFPNNWLPPPLLEGNRTDRNGDDGIDTENSDTTLTSNHAWFNGDFGIEALPGTLGGNNWAKHNANPAQCVPGFLCSTTGKPRK